MIDTRGKSCPEPVIMVKQAMESREDKYEVLADNKVSVENIKRFAEHAGYKAVATEADDEYTILITK